MERPSRTAPFLALFLGGCVELAHQIVHVHAVDHAQKFPAIALVKPGMVREQVEGVYPQGGHVLTHGAEHLARQPSPPVGFLEGTQVGGQVGPVVKIILNAPPPRRGCSHVQR